MQFKRELFCLFLQSADKTSEECFHTALDCLSRRKRDLLTSAIERAKTMATVLFKTVHSALNMKQIVSAGPFAYYIVQEVCTRVHEVYCILI